MNRVGEILARLRKEKGLSQKQLEQITHVSHVQISSYETGRVKPSKMIISKICPALGLDENFFDEYLSDIISPTTPEKLQAELDRFVGLRPSEVDMICVSKILRSLSQPYEESNNRASAA